MAQLRRLFRKLRTLLWTALTLIILLAAILVGVGKLMMPYSQQYQPQLEEWLSREFGQPVVIDSFTGEWKAFGPRISLEGVTLLGEGQQASEIAIQHAALDVKPLNLVLPGRPLYSFQIIGADLALVRTADGRYELSGLGVSGRGGGGGDNESLRNLAALGEIRLEDSSLGYDDESRGIALQLTGIRARLQMDGDEISTEFEADISDHFRTRVLGDLKATLLITLGADQRLSDARWHVKAGELMISELVSQLPQHTLVPRSGWLNAEIWGDWTADSAAVIQGVIDLRDSTLSERPRLLQLDHLNTRFRWNFRERSAWRVNLSDLTIDQGGKRWMTERMSIERNLPGNLGLWISSDFIDIEFPMLLTRRVMDNYATRWPRSMPRQARGRLHSFDLVLNDRWKLHLLRGRMDEVDAWEWGEGRFPDVAGINGTLDMLAGEGEIRFNGNGVRLDWPRNFERQAIVDIPGCVMEMTWGDAWGVDARQCRIEHQHFSISGRSRFAKSEGKPVLDINMQMHRVNIAEIDDFWPRSVMSEGVISWLEEGIVAGQATDGRYVMRGDLDDWPFRGNEGLVLAQAVINDAVLDYAEGWPRASGIDIETRFHNTRMEARGSVSDLGGVPVDEAVAVIPDFKQPVLEFGYRAGAPMPALLGFMERTPVLEDTDLDLSQFSFEGQAVTQGRLVTPLRAGLAETVLDGVLNLEENRFTELRSGISIDALAGEVSYSRDGMLGRDIKGRLRGQQANIGIRSDWDADTVFSAEVSGAFPVGEILPATLVQTEPLLARITGTADWQMLLDVHRPEGDSERETWLQMSSNLRGVEFELPVPLSKARNEDWPVVVRYPVNAAERVLTVDIADRFGMQFELGDDIGDARRASISFGGSMVGLPGDGLLSIGGESGYFDADQWMDLVIDRFSQPRPEGALQFERASIQLERMLFFNREFEDVGVNLEFKDGVLQGRMDSESIDGSFNYRQSPDGSHSLTAQLDRLHMSKPLNEGMTMDTDPASLPELHFYAREFSYHGMNIGETRIEAYPVSNGFRIESLEAVSPELNFQARGDWIQENGEARSDFDILLTSESLGALLTMLDVSSVLEGGQTIISYDAWWPGSPLAFAPSKLNGEMSVSVVDGRILNADAGAGRMVGLLSIAALPRRLALDFRDVFNSGFNFDRAEGTVLLDNGVAATEDLVLESTAASMAISGSSDLLNKDFDYQLIVRPGVGDTLPTIGAVIGGPGGAAAGLALQAMFRRSLGDATEVIYNISGPWTDPVVEPEQLPTPVPETVVEQEPGEDVE